jgi:phospholipase C
MRTVTRPTVRRLRAGADEAGTYVPRMMRRRSGVVGFAVLFVAGCGDGALREETRALTVDPATSGIEHVVVVMMENRSFDHMLG